MKENLQIGLNGQIHEEPEAEVPPPPPPAPPRLCVTCVNPPSILRYMRICVSKINFLTSIYIASRVMLRKQGMVGKGILDKAHFFCLLCLLTTRPCYQQFFFASASLTE